MCSARAAGADVDNLNLTSADHDEKMALGVDNRRNVKLSISVRIAVKITQLGENVGRKIVAVKFVLRMEIDLVRVGVVGRGRSESIAVAVKLAAGNQARSR